MVTALAGRQCESMWGRRGGRSSSGLKQRVDGKRSADLCLRPKTTAYQSQVTSDLTFCYADLLSTPHLPPLISASPLLPFSVTSWFPLSASHLLRSCAACTTQPTFPCTRTSRSMRDEDAARVSLCYICTHSTEQIHRFIRISPVIASNARGGPLSHHLPTLASLHPRVR